MNKKTLLTVIGILAGTVAFAASDFTNGWVPTSGEISSKHATAYSRSKDKMILKGIEGKDWTMFYSFQIKSEPGKKAVITFSASGKGKVFAGYFGYITGFTFKRTEEKPLNLTEKPQQFSLEFPIVKDVNIIRPKFRMTPGSEVEITNFKAEIK